MEKETDPITIIKGIMALISSADKFKNIIKLENGDYQVETGLGYFPSYIKLKSACEVRGLKVYEVLFKVLNMLLYQVLCTKNI